MFLVWASVFSSWIFFVSNILDTYIVYIFKFKTFGCVASALLCLKRKMRIGCWLTVQYSGFIKSKRPRLMESQMEYKTSQDALKIETFLKQILLLADSPVYSIQRNWIYLKRRKRNSHTYHVRIFSMNMSRDTTFALNSKIIFLKKNFWSEFHLRLSTF